MYRTQYASAGARTHAARGTHAHKHTHAHTHTQTHTHTHTHTHTSLLFLLLLFALTGSLLLACTVCHPLLMPLSPAASSFMFATAWAPDHLLHPTARTHTHTRTCQRGLALMCPLCNASLCRRRCSPHPPTFTTTPTQSKSARLPYPAWLLSRRASRS